MARCVVFTGAYGLALTLSVISIGGLVGLGGLGASLLPDGQSAGGAAGLGPIAWIGDGITDLEAAPECARFIAFGGIERRDLVFQLAIHSTCERDLSLLAPLLLAESAS